MKVPPNFKELLIQEYPWFTDEDIRLALHEISCGRSDHKGGSGGIDQPAKGDAPHIPPPALNEEDAAAAVAELIEFRDKWAWHKQDEFYHFYVFDRGGGSTKAAKGVASDCVACLARSWSYAWAKKHAGQGMHSFAFSTYDSVWACHVLAREWCMKQEHFYLEWLAAGRPSAMDYGACVPYAHSEDFYELVGSIDPMYATFVRLQEVFEWMPRTPDGASP